MSWGLACPGRMSVIRESSAGQRVPIGVRPSTSHAPHTASNPSPAVGRMLSSVKSLTSLLSSFVILSPVLCCSKEILIICLSFNIMFLSNITFPFAIFKSVDHLCMFMCTDSHAKDTQDVQYVPMYAPLCSFCCRLLVLHSRWSTWTCFSFASQYPLRLA